ncbi:aminotransferase class I/II-fold pyridoxal phosphate-dependent enzyme [Dasania marina]|uniref:aminotransferase class I/II-fold pyridoxal phosphate-dependent enzyme n=1 Tax=Dasania marina TaxID=471499 RepID=UPI0030D9915D
MNQNMNYSHAISPRKPNNFHSYNMLGFYHKFSQLRSDYWARLKEQLTRINSGKLSPLEYRVARRSIFATMTLLNNIEEYSAFPSKKDFSYLWSLLRKKDFENLSSAVHLIERALVNDAYHHKAVDLGQPATLNSHSTGQVFQHNDNSGQEDTRPYFEVLVVDAFHSSEDEEQIRATFLDLRHEDDKYIYNIVTVRSFEDALIAVLINRNIQSCIIRYGFDIRSKNHYDIFEHFSLNLSETELHKLSQTQLSIMLGEKIKHIRPEIDLFLVTADRVEETASLDADNFRRSFYREPGNIEHHGSILAGIHERYQTPFFTALKEYARKPTGVFHAMPLSRGKSINYSRWTKDFSNFYGKNIFLAETSATSGGLDSLLQPRGPIKHAQQLAARAFGAQETYFVTNGTSTANKIVVQTLVKPGDVVLIDRDCHKSHHYGMVMMGAQVSYLDSYPLNEFSIYGAVPLATIKRKLLEYKQAGRLHEVKLLILTNCTFDGIVYNVQQVMEECLAIKPDLIFIWDEAWFAFAAFNPSYRTRSAMYAAKQLQEKYSSASYQTEYQQFVAKQQAHDGEPSIDSLVAQKLLPDPAKVRLRVYATQSTHKTLTSMRQGSMIHIHDQDFRKKARGAFNEAYMTHTTTSPNYQILASLDVGRRQVELEGYELVHKQLETAFNLREQISASPLLSKYFRVLKNKDLIPEQYRVSGVESFYDPKTGWSRMEEAWQQDEFVLDPSRVTLHIGHAGIDGDTFKNTYLMNKYGIQINKTSRNTVLFMTNIGTSRSSVTFLLEVLVKLARQIKRNIEGFDSAEQLLHQRCVHSLTHEHPPLPDFSCFHPCFKTKHQHSPDGDIRRAFFMSYEEDNCEYLRFDNQDLQNAIAAGRQVVSAHFVTPYPPGFPVLVPGQVVSKDILDFLLKLDVTEIHGYQPELGIKVFKDDLLINDEKLVNHEELTG